MKKLILSLVVLFIAFGSISANEWFRRMIRQQHHNQNVVLAQKKDVVDCSSSPCENGGTCKTVKSGKKTTFQCLCKEPWVGTKCEQKFENPCTEELIELQEAHDAIDALRFKNPWSDKSFLTCTDVDHFQMMPCSAGTMYDEKLDHCIPEGFVPPKCGHNQKPVFDTKQDEIRCMCIEGFEGEKCDVNIDECNKMGGLTACNGGFCIDQTNGFYCGCEGNRVGLDCKNTILNPCTSENIQKNSLFFELIQTAPSVVFLHCVAEQEFEVKRCALGTFWNQEAKTCTKRIPKKKETKVTTPAPVVPPIVPANKGTLSQTEIDKLSKLLFDYVLTKDSGKQIAKNIAGSIVKGLNREQATQLENFMLSGEKVTPPLIDPIPPISNKNKGKKAFRV